MTYFLQISKSRRGKFFLVVLLFLIFLFIYYNFISIRNHLELKHLYKHPVSYSLSDELYGGEILINYDDGKYVATKALTNDGKPKTHLKISPDGQKLGYFLDLNYFIDKEKNKEINFIDYDNYTALMIMNKDGSDKKEIYRGDYHTSYWEWLDNQTVRVLRSAGTGVRIYRDININTSEPFIAKDHLSPEFWTPVKVESLKD